MRASQNCIALIDEFEGNRLRAYPDPKTGGAPWSIGRGHTGPEVVPGLIITPTQSDAYLADDLAAREAMVVNAVKVPLTQGQFDALVSIVYNVGAGSATRDGIIRLKSGQPSTLLRKLNAGDYQGAADAFLSWISPGSNVEAGLRRRRAAERALFLQQP